MKKIRIILLEDVRSDADIIQHELTKGDFVADVQWVQSREQFKIALTQFNPDIVISDHSLRGFNSSDAFMWLRQANLDIPFILVTATISEEFAVAMMKEGIADYVIKDRLQRLPAAVSNALEKWQSEREKKISLELLVSREKRFRALIENSNDMISLTDEHFKAFFVSTSYSRITGRTVDEGRDGTLDFVHPDDRGEYYSTLNEAINKPAQYFSLGYRMLHKQGVYIWVEGTVINMLDDEAIQGVVFNLRDVTARKEAEESLKRSRAHMTAILENASVSIYAIDRQFKYISFNSYLANSLKQVYGLNIKVGDPVFEFLGLLDPLELEGWEKIYTEAFSGNKVQFEKEFHVGEYYACISFSVNPIIEGHYVTGLSCFAWDVTTQKLSAKKVAQSESRFRALIENNYDAIVMRDEKMKVLYASPSVKRMLGYALEEVYEPEYGQIVHPDDAGTMSQTYNKLLSQPGIPFFVSVRIRRSNGTYIWTEGTITNMLDNENVKGIVSNFRDVTERKEGELQREKITLDLVERNNNLEQYAYIVSHNLRGPVANILGISNILDLKGASPKDKQEALSHLFASVRHLDEVIKDLNSILQLQQSIHEQKEDVSLSQLVSDVRLSIRDLLRKTDVEITTDFKIDKIATVKSYLYSIFYNLITNSIKYRKEGITPVIRITSGGHGNGTRLCFVDNGLGIDLQRHGSQLFGLYKRFHIDHAEGKGMGLFMTKTQVEALGGKISVKSEVNIGTEFIIDL
jgi:PAS domain S-box-containing protein